MATQELDHRLGEPSAEPRKLAAFDRSGRNGSIGLVLLVAFTLVGAALAFLLIGRGNAQPYILGLLSALDNHRSHSSHAVQPGGNVIGRHLPEPVLWNRI